MLCCGSSPHLEEPHQSPHFHRSLHVLHAGLPGFGAPASARAPPALPGASCLLAGAFHVFARFYARFALYARKRINLLREFITKIFNLTSH
jgi:hypothetical protein